jgi:hypothetical protein
VSSVSRLVRLLFVVAWWCTWPKLTTTTWHMEFMLLFVFIQPFTIIPTPIRVAESSRTVVQLRLAPKIKCLSSIVQMHGLDRTRGNTAPAQDIALHTIVSNGVTPNQGHRTAFAVSFLHGFLGLMQGVRHDEWIDAREQNGRKNVWLRQYFGRLVQLSRGRSLVFTRGEQDGWPGLEVAQHENDHEERRLSIFPWRSPII